MPSSNLFPAQVAASCQVAEFHSEILAGRAKFPCLTTPAPTPAGRPPPNKKKRSESPGTMARWGRGCRQSPPWQYRATALVKVGATWQVPTPEAREWLQGFPAGFTASLDAKARCQVPPVPYPLFCPSDFWVCPPLCAMVPCYGFCLRTV